MVRIIVHREARTEDYHALLVPSPSADSGTAREPVTISAPGIAKLGLVLHDVLAGKGWDSERQAMAFVGNHRTPSRARLMELAEDCKRWTLSNVDAA